MTTYGRRWPTSLVQLLFGKRPQRLPPFVWRRIYFLRVISSALVGTLLLYAVTLMATYHGLLNGSVVGDYADRLFDLDVFLVLMCVPYLEWGVIAAILLRIESVVRYARDREGKVCESCAFDLRGLPKTHVCPECGREYDLANTRANWEFVATPKLRWGCTAVGSHRALVWLIVLGTLGPALLALGVLLLKG